MALINPTSVNGLGGVSTPASTTLTAADTLTYKTGTRQVLLLTNPTAADITVTIDGDGATTIAPAGYGGTISVADGKAITVPDGESRIVRLQDIAAFLKGTVNVTGGTGLVAYLLEG